MVKFIKTHRLLPVLLVSSVFWLAFMYWITTMAINAGRIPDGHSPLWLYWLVSISAGLIVGNAMTVGMVSIGGFLSLKDMGIRRLPDDEDDDE